MIHVDTNILIEIVTLGSPMAKKLAEWLKTGEQLATSAIAWSEFLSGPVSEHQINGVKTVLADQIVQFGVAEAATAAAGERIGPTGTTRRRRLGSREALGRGGRGCHRGHVRHEDPPSKTRCAA